MMKKYLIEGRAHNGGGDKGGPRGRLNIVKNYLLWSSTTFDHSSGEENDEQAKLSVKISFGASRNNSKHL